MIVWRHSNLVIRKLPLFLFHYYFHYFQKEHALFYSLMCTFWQNDVCHRMHNTWRLLFSHNLYCNVLYLHTYNKQRLTLLLVVSLPVFSGTMVWSLDCVVLVSPPGLCNVAPFDFVTVGPSSRLAIFTCLHMFRMRLAKFAKLFPKLVFLLQVVFSVVS